MPQGPFLRKYGVQTTIDFALLAIDGIDYNVTAAHAAGDTKIMKDEGAEANTTNGFADEGQGYSIVLTAAEMTAARVVVYIVDAATKVWLDTSLVIETYGHASAMHAFDLGTASAAQTGDSFARIGAAGAGLTAIDLPDQTMNITGNLTGNVSGSVGSVTGAVGSVTGAVGSVTGAVGSVTAGVTVTANNDKTGYALSTAGILAIWHQLTSAIVTAGTIGLQLKTNLDAVLTARTLAAASYFDPAADTVANVATVATTTTNTDMRGTDGALTDKAEFSLSTAGILAIWHQLTSAVVTAGTLGKLIVDNLNATVSSRMAEASISTTGGTVDAVTTVATVTNDVNADVVKISGSAAAADALELSTETIISGTAAAGTLSTTEMTTDLAISVAEQYNGRIIIFQSDTTTAALRNQATDITATTILNGKLGFTALTTAPAAGDTFIIV